MNDSQAPPQPAIRPGWWIFSGLVLGVALLSLRIGLPWWRRAAFLDEIVHFEGRFETHPVGPDWLRNLVGEHAMRGFDEVVSIDVDGTQIDDSQFSKVNSFPEFESLDIAYTEVGDAGLSYLDGMLVTANGIAEIAELPNLTQLVISPDQITADGLDDLKRRHPKLDIVVTTADRDHSGHSMRQRHRRTKR
jgi:hypothetical protein